MRSSDRTHISWKNCPLALHGSYEGKWKGQQPDYNLWMWQLLFGFAGSLNDLNIWANSLLKLSFTNGMFCNTDFNYVIFGLTFTMLYYLIDGIYPELSRFLKTIPELIGKLERRFSMWQEAKRKDIERCFGVLQAKFHVLV